MSACTAKPSPLLWPTGRPLPTGNHRLLPQAPAHCRQHSLLCSLCARWVVACDTGRFGLSCKAFERWLLKVRNSLSCKRYHTCLQVHCLCSTRSELFCKVCIACLSVGLSIPDLDLCLNKACAKCVPAERLSHHSKLSCMIHVSLHKCHTLVLGTTSN